eukprot:477372-Prymnesium_polylepis.1
MDNQALIATSWHTRTGTWRYLGRLVRKIRPPMVDMCIAACRHRTGVTARSGGGRQGVVKLGSESVRRATVFGLCVTSVTSYTSVHVV